MPNHPQLQALVNLYNDNPSSFSNEELGILQKNLRQEGMEYTPKPADKDLWDVSIGAVTNLVNGFVTGFTTIPVGKEPRNTTDAIANNIGHLLGFVGYFPGIGSVAKASAMGIGGIVGRSLAKGGVAAAKAANVAGGIARVGRHASVPMAGANLIMEGFQRSAILRSAGKKTAEFMTRHGVSQTVLKNLTYAGEGAVHLGLASAVSAAPPWELAVDERLDALMSGAIAGGVFRGAGIFFPNAVGNLPNKDLFRNLVASAKDPKGLMRMASMSLFMGLPATAQGAPTELQVYQYLTGIVFGAGEMSAHQRSWMKFYQNVPRAKYGELPSDIHQIMMYKAEKNFPEEYAKLSPQAKEIHAEQMKLMGYKITGNDFNNPAPSYVAKGQVEAIDARKRTLLKELEEGKISEENYQRLMREYRVYEMGKEFNKQLEEKVEEAVTKDIVEGSTKSREQLELEHSERIHDEMLGELSESYRAEMDFIKQEVQMEGEVYDLGRSLGMEELRKWRTFVTEYAFDEKDIPATTFQRPIEKLVLESFKGEEFSSEQINLRTREVVDIISKHTSKKSDIKDLVKELEESYGMEIKEPAHGKDNLLYRHVAQAFHRAKMNTHYDRIINLDAGIVESSYNYNGVYSDGTDAVNYKHRTYLRKALEDAGYKDFQIAVVKRVKTNGTDRHLLESEVPFSKLEEIANKEGWSIFAGVKDSPKMVLVKYLFNEKVTPESVIDRITNTEEKLARFNEYLSLKGLKGEEHSRFLKNFANNVLILESLNKRKIEDILDVEGFIGKAKDLNKRITLIMNGFKEMEASNFEGVAKDGKLTTVILRSKNEEGEQVPGKDIKRKAYDEVGHLIEIVESTHLDGAFLQRGDVFDRAALTIGSELEVSGMKGTLTHGDDRGMMLGKYLYHRATPELDAWMKKNNVHQILFTDSIKQLGERSSSDWTWEKGKLHIKDESAKYDIPVESFSVTEAGEHRTQMGKILENGKVSGKDPTLPVQFSSTLDYRHYSTRAWLKEKIEEAYNGDPEQNRLVDEYLSNTNKNSDNINLEDIGLEAKLKILWKGEGSKLYDKLVEKLMVSREEDLAMDDLAVIDYDKFIKKMRGVNQSTVDRILSLTKPTPALMHSTLIQPYFLKVLQSSLIKSIVRPKNTGGWVSKMHPAFGEILEKYDLQPGTMLISRELASKKLIPWIGGEEVTIEKAFAGYLKAKKNKDVSNDVILEMEDLLSVGAQRVPTDDASGIRILRIAGIVDGMPGTPGWVHPHDMVRMGGADLDGDSFHIIPRLPKKAKAELRKTMTNFDDKNGVFHTPKPKNSEFKAPMDPRMEKLLEQPFGMLDPEVMAYINKASSETNSKLGFGIDEAKRINALLTMHKDYLGLLVPKGDRTEFYKKRAEFINMVADAADGIKLQPMEKITEILMKSAFEPQSVDLYNRYRKLTDKVRIDRDKVTDAEWKELSELAVEGKTTRNTIKNLKNLDSVIKGRKFNSRTKEYMNLTLEDVVDNAVEAGKYFEYHKKQGGIFNPYYMAAMTVSELPYMDYMKPLTFMSQYFNGVAKKATNWIRRHPEVLELLEREKVTFTNEPKLKGDSEMERVTTLNELKTNDAFDLGFIPLLLHFKKDIPKDIVLSIKKFADEVTRDLVKDRALVRSGKVRGEDNQREDMSVAELYRIVDQRVQRWGETRSDAEKKLLSVYLLNPFRAQNMSREDYFAEQKKIYEGLDPKKKREVRKPTDEVLNAEWNSTDIKSRPWELKTLEPEVVAKYMDIFSELIQKKPGGVPGKNLENIVKDMVEDNIFGHNLELEHTPEYILEGNWSKQIRNKSKEITNDPKGEKEIALAKVTEQVKKFLTKYPAFISEFESLAEGIILDRGKFVDRATSLASATPDQIIHLGKVLEDITNNRWNAREIKKADYFFRILSTIGREFIKYDPRSFKERVPIVFTKEDGTLGTGHKDIIRLTSTIGEAATSFNKANFRTDGANTEDKEKVTESDWYNTAVTLSENYKGLGDTLFTIAMAQKQVNTSNKTTHYRDRYNSLLPEYNAIIAQNKSYYVPALKKEMKAQEIVEYFKNEITSLFKDLAGTKMYNPAYERWFENRYDGSNELGGKSLYEDGYPVLERWAVALEHYNNRGSGKHLGMNLAAYLQHWYLLEQHARVKPLGLINEAIFNRYNRRFFGPELAERYRMARESQEERASARFQTIEEALESPLLTQLRNNLEGMQDGYEKEMLREIFRSENIAEHEGFLLKDRPREEKHYFYGKWNIHPDRHRPIEFDEVWSNNYFPNMEHSKNEVSNFVTNRMLDRIQEGGTHAHTVQEMRERLLSVRETAEETRLNSFMDMLEARNEFSVEDLKNATINLANTRSRSDDPTPGWALHKDIPLRYAEKLNSVYYKFMASFQAQFGLKRLEAEFKKARARGEQGGLGDKTDDWIQFMQIYIRNNLGMSSTYPKEMLENKDLKLKNSPYYAFTDEAYYNLFEKISKKWFRGRSFFDKALGMMTEEQFNALSESDRKKIKSMVKQDFSRFVNRVSMLEAKWSFLSLLTHTKTFIANLAGGTLNTVANVGIHPFLKSRSFDYMKRNHFTEINSKEDLLKVAEEHGAVEQMFKMELGIQHALKGGKFKEAGKSILNYLRKNPYDESAVRRLAGKTGITDAMFNSAAWFMRKSEVMLRSRSYLAHLIKAKESLNMMGLDMPNDHPWLVQLANRGVAATQFLYTNANRPMFAQTAIGKMYSRFQLWAWNSVKFRKDLVEQANEFGWQEGSEEFNRLKRIMTADMFMLALATTVPSSIFENNLAPPFSYLQDLSDYFFGDNDDRERAFYGVLPFPANILQPVSPPSTRVLFDSIQYMATGELDRLGNRVWSWFPFGRFAKSFDRSIKSPITTVDNFTSFPLTRVHKLMTDDKKKKKRDYQPTPGPIKLRDIL